MNIRNESRALNGAWRIFEKHRLAQEMFPELNDGEYFIVHAETVYDIIQEVAALFEKEHPLWNFPETRNREEPE